MKFRDEGDAGRFCIKCLGNKTLGGVGVAGLRREFDPVQEACQWPRTSTTLVRRLYERAYDTHRRRTLAAYTRKMGVYRVSYCYPREEDTVKCYRAMGPTTNPPFEAAKGRVKGRNVKLIQSRLIPEDLFGSSEVPPEVFVLHVPVGCY